MKKLSCTLLVLLCILTAFTAAVAEESMTMLYTFESADMVGSVTVWDGKLIATDNAANYVVIDPSAGAEPAESSIEDLYPEIEGYWVINSELVPADDGIYMVFYLLPESDAAEPDLRVVLKKLTAENSKLIARSEWELDWTPVEDALGSYAVHATVWSPCIVNGMLVGNIYPASGPGYIAKFDIAGSKCELIDTDAEIMGLYVDGKLLAEYVDHQSEDAPAIISAFDPATGNSEELVSISREKYYGCQYAAYDAESNKLYYIKNGELFVMENMDPDSVKSAGAVRTNLNYYSQATAMSGNLYICNAGAALYSYDAAMLTEFESLTIANYCGGYEAEADVSQAFAEAHPEIIVTDYYPGNDADMLLDSSFDADICMMNVSSGEYELLYDMGVMLPLDSSIITDSVSEMYPWAQEYLTKDGAVVAVPVQFIPAPGFSYYPLAFEALGLSADDVPATWTEFLQLLQNFPELAGENSEVCAFPSKYSADDVREMVLSNLIAAYEAYLDAAGQAVSFDTDLFRGLIDEFSRIDFDALVAGDTKSFIANGTSDVLFARGEAVSPYAYAYHSVDVNAPLLLAFEDDEEPIISAELHVAFVLPGSDNAELATEYLQMIVENNPEIINIQLSPAHNDTVISPSFESDIAFYTEKIAEIEAGIAGASGDELAQLESDLEYWNGQLREFEGGLDPFAWEVSFESIEWYRGLADYVRPQSNCGLDDAVHALISDICAEYLSGTIADTDLVGSLEDCLSTMILKAN